MFSASYFQIYCSEKIEIFLVFFESFVFFAVKKKQ